jgi:hypothetical protein
MNRNSNWHMFNVYKVDQGMVWQAFSTHKLMTCIYCDAFTSAVAINCSYRRQYVRVAQRFARAVLSARQTNVCVHWSEVYTRPIRLKMCASVYGVCGRAFRGSTGRTPVKGTRGRKLAIFRILTWTIQASI